MGGDGGVIASNRRYMRGAGTADHTADSGSSDKVDPAVEREELMRSMRTCAVSNQPLDFKAAHIVVCPYGRLYNKEAAVESLLRRKQTEGTDELGAHIRGLKDLHQVRFHVVKSSTGELAPACPIRGTELNGNIPAVALLPGGTVNVVSERAIKDMGKEAVLDDYGPADETIRLAPPAALLEEIKEALQKKRALEKEAKRAKKEKKRKRAKEDSESPKKKTASTSS